MLLAWALGSAFVTNGLILWAVYVGAGMRRPQASRQDAGRVAIVRPIRGIDDSALTKHRTLFEQDYGEIAEVVFVLESAADAGCEAATAACTLAPERARLVFSGEGVGHGKTRNMIAGWRATRAPIVVFCDSDIALEPDDIGRCCALLADPGVGAAFTPSLFDAGGVAGRLAMLTATVDKYTLLLGAVHLNTVPVLEGGLMAVRRDAIEASGGIEGIADAIADDQRIGNLVRSAGYRLRAVTKPLIHTTPGERATAWARRYHRWMTCHRAEAPIAFSIQLLCNGVAVPLIAALAVPSGVHGVFAKLILLASSTARIVVSLLAIRSLPELRRVNIGFWVIAKPLADLLHFGFCVAAVVYPRVQWRGYSYWVGKDGRITSVHEVAEEGCAVRDGLSAG